MAADPSGRMQVFCFAVRKERRDTSAPVQHTEWFGLRFKTEGTFNISFKMLTRETQSLLPPGFIQITSGFLLTASVWLPEWDKVSTFLFQIFLHVVFLLSQQTVPHDSPKVYKFSMWFWNTYWQSLVQEERTGGNTLDWPRSTWLVPASV